MYADLKQPFVSQTTSTTVSSRSIFAVPNYDLASLEVGDELDIDITPLPIPLETIPHLQIMAVAPDEPDPRLNDTLLPNSVKAIPHFEIMDAAPDDKPDTRLNNRMIRDKTEDQHDVSANLSFRLLRKIKRTFYFIISPKGFKR